MPYGREYKFAALSIMLLNHVRQTESRLCRLFGRVSGVIYSWQLRAQSQTNYSEILPGGCLTFGLGLTLVVSRTRVSEGSSFCDVFVLKSCLSPVPSCVWPSHDDNVCMSE